MSDFFHGCSFVFKGISAFYNHAAAMKYSAIPICLMVLFYGILGALIYWGGSEMNGWLESMMASWPEWLQSTTLFLINLFVGIVALCLFLGTASAIYEMFAGLFFDTMVEAYESEKFGFKAVEMTREQMWKFFFDGFAWGLGTALLFLPVLIVSSLIPLVGPVFTIAVMGYRLGVACLLSTSFNHRIGLGGLLQLTRFRRSLVLGYGVMAYLVMMVPILPIFLLPGIILGGTLLYREAWIRQ